MEATDNQVGLKPEDARAALGFSNNLLMGMLPQQQAEEGSQEPQEPQGEEMTPEPEEEAPEDKTVEIEAKMGQMGDDLRKEMHAMKDDIMSSFKEMLNEALNESED